MATEKTGKRNFTETEVEVLVGEVEARKNILFGGLGSGISNKRKTEEWQHVVAAVNSVGVTERSVPDIKKKWSDLKVEAKRRMARHRQGMCATGGGPATPNPTPLELKIASILGPASIYGIVPENEGDTDQADATAETVTLQMEAVGEEIPGTSTEEMVRPTTSAPRAHGTAGGGRVLTDAVLQTQRDTIDAVKEIRDELHQIRHVISGMCAVLSEISTSLKELVKK
ncbi:nuclear apoptosis-inducing factor 1-like [Melanotaenia boesemani]|uniref:nuclear apoptosis-inducing factor 1-like n=1 Tax=Melanotaenia boesemani TaxID=1250792 RepID=UPI001C045C5C|nr:nuclear apoptosis-inducing factor 1-like [Melanotaenia boesemani]